MDSEETLSAKVSQLAKQTVGYKEAENKESFMVGVTVGCRKAYDLLAEENKELKRQADMYKTMYENVNGDIKTITSIIDRYSKND